MSAFQKLASSLTVAAAFTTSAVAADAPTSPTLTNVITYQGICVRTEIRQAQPQTEYHVRLKAHDRALLVDETYVRGKAAFFANFNHGLPKGSNFDLYHKAQGAEFASAVKALDQAKRKGSPQTPFCEPTI